MGVVALALAAVALRREVSEDGRRSTGTSFDWIGAGLSSVVLVCFLLAITNGHKLGWYSPAIIAGFGAAVVAGAVFIWWEGRAEAPMLDLSFFSSKVFTLGVSARFLSFLAGSAVYFIMPFYLVQGLGLEPSKAGLLMVPGSVAIAVWGPVSGRLSDRIGTRWLTVLGMALAGAGMLMFAGLDENSSTLRVMFSILVEGTGIGLFSSPNTSAIMTAIDSRKFSVASAFLNLVRTSAGLSGIAIFTGYRGVHHGVARVCAGPVGGVSGGRRRGAAGVHHGYEQGVLRRRGGDVRGDGRICAAPGKSRHQHRNPGWTELGRAQKLFPVSLPRSEAALCPGEQVGHAVGFGMVLSREMHGYVALSHHGEHYDREGLDTHNAAYD